MSAKQDLPKKTQSKGQQEQSMEPQFFTPKMMEAEEIKTLISWEAASRPFRKKDRSYYTTLAIIVILLALILFIAKEFLLIATLLSLAFVAYVLAFVPPHNITYRISTQGVTIGEDFYFWHFLDAFWFTKKEGSTILHIQTRLRFPAQLMLVLGPSTHSTSAQGRTEQSRSTTGSGQAEEEKVKKIVARFLPFVEVPYKTWLEKWSEGLQKHFPLENIHR